jgi:predicted enzyme related to lactoylglutathione lyase
VKWNHATRSGINCARRAAHRHRQPRTIAPHGRGGRYSDLEEVTTRNHGARQIRNEFMNSDRNPVGWFEIYVQDMDRAKTFYEKILAATFQKLESPGVEMWAFPMQMEAAGAAGALVKMEGKDSGPGGTIVYFSSDDCAVIASRAVENGGKVVKEKFSIGQYGFIAFVNDTEGNLIGLHAMQ